MAQRVKGITVLLPQSQLIDCTIPKAKLISQNRLESEVTALSPEVEVQSFRLADVALALDIDLFT